MEENQDFKLYYPDWVEDSIIFKAMSATMKRRFSVLKFGMQHFMRAEVKDGKVHLIFVDDYAYNFAYYFFTLKELDIKYRDLMFPIEFISNSSDIEYFRVDQNGELYQIESHNFGFSHYTFYFTLTDNAEFEVVLAVMFRDSSKANLLIRFNLENCKTKTAHYEKWKKTFDKEFHEYFSIYSESLKYKTRECFSYDFIAPVYIKDHFKQKYGEPVRITLTQKLFPYRSYIVEYVKSDEDFVEFLRKAIEEHPSLISLSTEIYRHFESNYPPHMFDAATLKMAKLATEIASQFFDKTPESDSQNIYEQIKELHKCRKDIK